MTTTTTITQRDLIKARMKNTRAWLNTVLRKLTPDQLDWAPTEGMRTVAGQLAEIITVEIPLVPHLKEGRQPEEAEVDAVVGDQHNLENLLQKLIDVRQTTLDYLDSLTDEQISEVVPSGEAWFGTMWLPEMPRSEFFLNIAEHEYYHVGQLISYLWCKGQEWEPSWFRQS
jgi:uncharacterized damage-inducible protein DinB